MSIAFNNYDLYIIGGIRRTCFADEGILYDCDDCELKPSKKYVIPSHLESLIPKYERETVRDLSWVETRFHPLVYAYRRGAIRRAFWLTNGRLYTINKRDKKFRWGSENWNWFMRHISEFLYFQIETLNDLISLMLVDRTSYHFMKYLVEKYDPRTRGLKYCIYPYSTWQPRLNGMRFLFKKYRRSKWDFQSKKVLGTFYEEEGQDFNIQGVFMRKCHQYRDPIHLVRKGHINVFNSLKVGGQKEMLKRFYRAGLHFETPEVNIAKSKTKNFAKPCMYARNKKIDKMITYQKSYPPPQRRNKHTGKQLNHQNSHKREFRNSTKWIIRN